MTANKSEQNPDTVAAIVGRVTFCGVLAVGVVGAAALGAGAFSIIGGAAIAIAASKLVSDRREAKKAAEERAEDAVTLARTIAEDERRRSQPMKPGEIRFATLTADEVAQAKPEPEDVEPRLTLREEIRRWRAERRRKADVQHADNVMRPRCNHCMPVAKRPCVLPAGHPRGHRSTR